MTLEHAILAVLDKAKLPLKASDITKLVKPLVGRAATPKAVVVALTALVSSAALNGISGKPQPLYTTQSLESAAAAMLQHGIHAAKNAQPAAKLKGKLPEALQPHFEPALEQLVATGAAFVLPGAKRFVFAGRPKPSALLDAAKRRALQKILDGVNGARPQAATLAEFIAWLDAEPAAVPTQAAAAVPGEAEIQQWYALDRVRSSTVMIPIPQTFARYAAWAAERGQAADSQVLRNLIEMLYNNGRLLLEPCERPQDLPEHERAMLVPMSLGPPGYSWCWIA